MEKEKAIFYRLVYPSRPNDWEVEEILVELQTLSSKHQRKLLEHVPAIWPVSNSLCLSFLKEGVRFSTVIPTPLLAEWVRQILHHYEVGGLRSARQFMADVHTQFLNSFSKNSQLRLSDVQQRLTTFLRGLSGENLDLSPHQDIHTDTKTIFLPPLLDLFPAKEDNYLYSKLLLSVHWYHIMLGTFTADRDITPHVQFNANNESSSRDSNEKTVFSHYLNQGLASDLFHLLELKRVMTHLQNSLPGLMRASRQIRDQVSERIITESSTENFSINELFSSVFSAKKDKPAHLIKWMNKNLSDTGDGRKSLELLPKFYSLAQQDAPLYLGCQFNEYIGKLYLSKAHKVMDIRTKENRELFIDQLATILSANAKNEGDEKNSALISENADKIQLVVSQGTSSPEKENKPTLKLANFEMELPEELITLQDDIMQDLETLPFSYITAAVGLAGMGLPPMESTTAEEPAKGHTIKSDIMYDEWDFRRGGYRKNWCSLFLRSLDGKKSNFVSNTLDKHRGHIISLRRRFEMMRTVERFARRRRHGDDLDLDALVDSFGDQRAGFPPSEHLYVRLLRDERDIATLFLVDMSNSTEGWIGDTIKESLILLCESMTSIGDRYGIYGFSGMRRSRCDIYNIKHLNEKYAENVRNRIGVISPKEYTRMGAPIRYLTDLLDKVNSKVRLIIVLSDGKPEDYDDYKGEYAIEDTRKALIEARGKGIQPFCITIDRAPHDYLSHMYGANNYTFISKVETLPVRMMEIYRLLTLR